MAPGSSTTMPAGVEVLGPLAEGYDEILSPDALAFLAELERRFGPTRHELLARRQEVDARLQAGELPDFLEETRARSARRTGRSRRCRATSWTGGSRSPGRSIAR